MEKVIPFLLFVLRIAPSVYKWAEERYPAKKMDRVRFKARLSREAQSRLKLKLYVDITNYCATPIVLSSAYFILTEPTIFGHDPQLPRDAASKRHNCQFQGNPKKDHVEISYLLKPDETTNTFIPIDPNHNEADVEKALSKGNLGKFFVHVTWWTDLEIPKSRLVEVNLS